MQTKRLRALSEPQRRRAGRENGREAIAREAIRAMEPLVELLLEIGITSPEAESLLRGLFVHKSRDWLARQSDGADPSDVRIALVTGVHRNFVSRLLAEPATIPASRRRRGHRAGRLLQAWHTESLYLDSSGKPRDLPQRGPEPSFESLATKYVPGSPAAVVLQELQRAGVVQRLGDQRVRARSPVMRTPGLNMLNIGDMSKSVKELLETMVRNIRDPDDQLFCDSLAAIELDESRLAVVREVLSRRASGFLQSLQAELTAERKKRLARSGKRVTLSLTVFESQVSGRGGGRGER